MTLTALGHPMVCVALRDPADLTGLPEGVCGLAVYEYSADSLRWRGHWRLWDSRWSALSCATPPT